MKKSLSFFMAVFLFFCTIDGQDKLFPDNGTEIFEINSITNISVLTIESDSEILTVPQSDPSDDIESSNSFMVAGGVGNGYGGIGLQLQARFDWIGIHAGFGYLPEHSDELARGLISGGVKLYLYNELYLNAQFGTFGAKKNLVQMGPSLLIGGNIMLSDHYGLNSALGLLMDVSISEIPIHPAFDIGFIYKF